MSLTTEQVDALLAPLDPGRVRKLDGNSHLEAWDVRRHLLRVFGWGGWDFTVVECTCVSERSKWDEQNLLKGRHTVVYRVIGRLTVKDRDGSVLAVFEDGATGDGINQPSLQAAHDFALKSAMSQALKRCAINLGDRFGLSLYNKGQAGATVGKTLGNDSTREHEASETVEGGDMDHQPDVDAHNAQQEQAAAALTQPEQPPAPAPSSEEVEQAKANEVHAFREYLLAGPSAAGAKPGEFYAKAHVAAVRKGIAHEQTTDRSTAVVVLKDLIDQELERAS